MKDIFSLCIRATSSIREAIKTIDINVTGIVLVVDEERKLLGTITDGDIRRALLAEHSLDQPITNILTKKSESPYPTPVTAPVGVTDNEALSLMQEKVVRQLPLLDEDGVVVDLLTIDDLLPKQSLPIQAVIMAGGFGKRLSPLTDNLPKPLLPVGGRPLMEFIIEQLRNSGIQNINVSTHYMPEKISSHFGDGKEYDVNINYISENEPLGTAGALGKIQQGEEPILVINGDVLTKLNFRDMLSFHKKENADITIGVRQYNMNVPYGVIKSEGSNVVEITEKPEYSFLVNGGIYIIEPSALGYVPKNRSFDMTELIEVLLKNKKKASSFLILDYWIDVGQHKDYEQAQADINSGRFKR